MFLSQGSTDQEGYMAFSESGRGLAFFCMHTLQELVVCNFLSAQMAAGVVLVRCGPISRRSVRAAQVMRC